MVEYDHDRWHDDHDRQERGRIAQIRHAYGPDDNWARGAAGRYGAGGNEPARRRQRDDIGVDRPGQAFAGSEERGHGHDSDYRGRGPKGYRRSDERITEDVSDRLADDRYVDASDIEVSVEHGEVTLGGSVDDRQTRRRAEDIAEQVSGVTYVQNLLRVKGRLGGGRGTATSAATFDAGSGQVPGPSVEASENRSANSQLPL